MYRLIREDQVTCRRPHRCEWCAETIKKNEIAVYRVYVFEGDFRHGWQHLECNRAMCDTHNDVLLGGWMAGDAKRGEALELDCDCWKALEGGK